MAKRRQGFDFARHFKGKRRRNKTQLSLKDEDVEKIDDQKLKNEVSEREKDHFALIIEKSCNGKS